MATNYSRGRAFEYRTRDKLLDMGAAYVMRAAQSKGKVDLLALFPKHLVHEWPKVWLVQCKHSVHGGGRLSAAEAGELVALALEVGGIPYLATPGKNGRGVEFINLLNEGA